MILWLKCLNLISKWNELKTDLLNNIRRLKKLKKKDKKKWTKGDKNKLNIKETKISPNKGSKISKP